MRLSSFAFLAPTSALLVAVGCTDVDAAGRTRIAFDVEIAGGGQASTLPTAGARPIRLDAATLHLGGLTFFEGDALFASRSLVDEMLSFASARAHPGHYTPGEALADTPAAGVVDLLAPAPVVVTADGLSGAYGSMTLPLVGGDTLSLTGVLVGGDGGDVPFTAALDFPFSVEGIACVVDEMKGRRVQLDIQVPELVRRIDTDLLPVAPGTVVDLAVAGQARNALERALEAQTTYSLTTLEQP
jgi:hypothetical protein